jgi:hypothetical protein
VSAAGPLRGPVNGGGCAAAGLPAPAEGYGAETSGQAQGLPAPARAQASQPTSQDHHKRSLHGSRGIPLARPWTRLSSVAVRGNRRLHRPSWRPHAVRYTSVDTATQRSTALRDDTRRDQEETARTATYSQLAGRFRRWWQVMDSNHRRRSRRFYSRLSIRVICHWPAVMRDETALRATAVRYASVRCGLGGGAPHGRARTAGVGAVYRPQQERCADRSRRGIPTVLPGLWLLTCTFRMPARCRRLLPRQGRARPRRRPGRW